MIRVLFDAFYHMMPGHRIGDHISVGGYQENFGRYTPGDCFHPNGLSFFNADLAGEYDVRLLTQPYSDAAFFDADILLIANPDYPLYSGASPYRWTPQDVDALLRFVDRGGGILLLINSFLSRPDFWEENFDLERVSLLLDRFGIQWDPNYMSDDKTIERAQAGSLCVGYGQGGRVLTTSLPDNAMPLITYKNNVYGFKVKHGNGCLVVVGDTGMISNGLICFPDFENAIFFKNIFKTLSPRWKSVKPNCWDFRSYAQISTVPNKNGIDENILRGMRPEAVWIDDHHYRHLVWDEIPLTSVHDKIWNEIPFEISKIKKESKACLTLSWLPLNANMLGPKTHLNVSINALEGREFTDLHIIGRTQCDQLAWDGFLNIESKSMASKIEQVHMIFEMKLVLDKEDQPLCARWSQGQIIYAKNLQSDHYGYEIVLSSRNSVISPRTV
jgi:hypothetical protein